MKSPLLSTLVVFGVTLAFAADELPKTLMTERGKLIVNEILATMPADVSKGGAIADLKHGWQMRPGKWEIIDGALRGYQLEADKHSAAAFFAQTWKDAVLQFDVKLDGCSQIVFCIDDPAAMRPATPTRAAQNRVEHLCRLIINKDGFSTQKDDHDHDGPDVNVPFGTVKMPFMPGEWHTVLIEIKGEEMVTTIDGLTIAGAHPQVGADKAYVSFGVSGYSNGFDKVPPLSASYRNFRIWEAKPNVAWAENKAKLATITATSPALYTRLWPGKAPIGDGRTEIWTKELRVHLPPAAKSNGAAVVICPGGGYIRHVTDREGYPIAEWLNAHGIAAIILEYRLPEGRSFVPLLDAQRAIRTMRANAAAWHIDPKRVGILGFSAGGHVASTAGTHFDAGKRDAVDVIERLSSRPDFMLLVYPVVTMGDKTYTGSKSKLIGDDPKPEFVKLFSNELQVTRETPPAFIAHAADDTPVPPENSRNLVAALKVNHVPVEYLELPSGGHGLNGCKGPLWEQWKAASLVWLTAQKFIPTGAH